MGGNLTKFTGIPFSRRDPYDYLRAKNLLRALVHSLLESSIDLKRCYPILNHLNHPIREMENLVWDFISLDQNIDDFTKFPHLTIVMRDHSVKFQITVPNAALARYWDKLKKTSKRDWQGIFLKISKKVAGLESSENRNSPQPYIELLQRHFQHIGAEPYRDGELFFSLDAVMDGNKKHSPRVKTVSVWGNYVKPLIDSKPKANIQLAIGVQYYYRDYSAPSSIIRSEKFKDEAVKALCALEPFYNLLYPA